MIKKFFFLLTLASLSSQAQIDFREIKFGLVAGGNYSRVRNAHNPSGARISVLGGVSAQVPIGYTEQFYIQAEVGYYGAGEGGDRIYEKNKNWPHAVYANNYLSVPVNFKAYFSEAESEFFGIIGPRFNFLMGQVVKNPPVGKEYYDATSYGKANNFNLAIGAGLGYSYRRKLELAIRTDVGLSDTYPQLKNSPDNLIGDATVAKKKSEQVISLSLTYMFE